MDDAEDEFTIEQQLACMPLDASWEDRPLPRPHDAFAGQPMAAQKMAFVDMGQVHAMITDRNNRIALLSQKLLCVQDQLDAATRLREDLLMQINYKREVCAAQTMFLFQHWGKHPDWTKYDAFRAMEEHIREALTHRTAANQLLHSMLDRHEHKNARHVQ